MRRVEGYAQKRRQGKERVLPRSIRLVFVMISAQSFVFLAIFSDFISSSQINSRPARLITINNARPNSPPHTLLYLPPHSHYGPPYSNPTPHSLHAQPYSKTLPSRNPNLRPPPPAPLHPPILHATRKHHRRRCRRYNAGWDIHASRG